MSQADVSARAASPQAKPARAAARTKPGRPIRHVNEVTLRERILDAAERLFATSGYEAVSVRAVAREVEATAAMIHYYFESKRALFDAVFERRAKVLNEERMAAFDAYEASVADKPSVEGAIQAFLSPVLQKLKTGDPGWRHYLELVAQVGNTHEWGGEVMTHSFDPVIQRLIGIIRCALPGASETELYWSYHFLSGALLLTLSETDRIDRLSSGNCRSTDIAAIEPRLVQYAAAGFRRVCSAQ